MTTKSAPFCGTHKVLKEWRPTTFEYSDEGVTVRIPNIYAWICPESGEASFTPETADEIIETVNELAEIAKRAKTRRSGFTEYFVSVATRI
jgi:YgiT-type zinc finger domain-containing protein